MPLINTENQKVLKVFQAIVYYKPHRPTHNKHKDTIMRHSQVFFWKTLLLSTASAAAITGCSSAPPAKPAHDPYDTYYGHPDLQSRDAAQTGDIIVNPSAPRTYTVQKGDTLWGIARKFLNTPWYWPEVWDKNQRIQNPHLIYPGDVLTLDYAPGNNGKLVPRIRVDRGGLEGEPVSTLIPFLQWPRVLDEATIKNAPYILASQDDHHLIGEGETVYVKNLHNSAEGERCAIFHPNKPLTDPNTGVTLGYEVTYGGYGKIERPGNPATARVIESRREIRTGDRLFAESDDTRNLNAPIHAPGFKVRGDIASLYDAEAFSGSYMIAVINKGQNDHIEVGHTLGIYATGKTVRDPYQMQKLRSGAQVPAETQLPPEKAATLVIYKVTDKVSYGLIMDATREVRRGYKVGNP
jgi:hypothetical protein